MAQGQLTHIEIPADDPARARAFYSGLLGWETSEMPQFPNYFLFSFGKVDRSGGAIGTRGQSVGDKLRVYFDVDSLDATLAKVAGLGGKVVAPKVEIPGQGWFAVLNDTEGNEIALYEGMPEAAM